MLNISLNTFLALLKNDVEGMGLHPSPSHVKLEGAVKKPTQLSKRVGHVVPRGVAPPITHLRVMCMLFMDT